jgi:hypothetical protein
MTRSWSGQMLHPSQASDSFPDRRLKGGRYRTHTVYIEQWVILSLHANILDFRQSTLNFMIGSNSDRSAFKVRSPKLCKAIIIYAHHDDLRSFAQLSISIPDWRKRLTSDRTHGQWTNAYKSARDSWLTSLTIILFTRVAPCTKSKGIPIDAPHIFYYFQHALHRVQKARGFIGMCSKFIILLIKFSKVFVA